LRCRREFDPPSAPAFRGHVWWRLRQRHFSPWIAFNGRRNSLFVPMQDGWWAARLGNSLRQLYLGPVASTIILTALCPLFVAAGLGLWAFLERRIRSRGSRGNLPCRFAPVPGPAESNKTRRQKVQKR
jgi:hypothetical protein